MEKGKKKANKYGDKNTKTKRCREGILVGHSFEKAFSSNKPPSQISLPLEPASF